MSKVNLDAIKVDMLKKREKIERLEKRIKYLQEKVFYTLECKGCGQHWDTVILSSEYDRIYYWKADHCNTYTVMNERFLALTCPGCGYEHPLRKSFNCRYETETEPESDRINIKEFSPNNFVSVKKIYNLTGRFYGYGES